MPENAGEGKGERGSVKKWQQDQITGLRYARKHVLCAEADSLEPAPGDSRWGRGLRRWTFPGGRRNTWWKMEGARKRTGLQGIHEEAHSLTRQRDPASPVIKRSSKGMYFVSECAQSVRILTQKSTQCWPVLIYPALCPRSLPPTDLPRGPSGSAALSLFGFFPRLLRSIRWMSLKLTFFVLVFLFF